MRPSFLAKVALPGSGAPVLPILFRPCQYLSNEHPIKVLTWCEALADSTNLIYIVYLAHLKPLGQQLNKHKHCIFPLNYLVLNGRLDLIVISGFASLGTLLTRR